jgi:AraC-like DNA-binding protein
MLTNAPDSAPAPLAVAERTYVDQPGLHRHSYYQLIFPNRGEMLLSVEGRRLAVTPASWAVIPAGVVHVYWAEGPNHVLVADVAAAAMAGDGDGPPEAGDFLRPRDGRLAALAALLASEMRAGALAEPTVAEALAGYLGAAVAHALRPASQAQGAPGLRLAARAREFVEANAAAPLSLEAIAAAAGASVAHVQRSFRAAYGLTVVEHLQAVRLRHAQNLLRDTDMPVEAVAAAVGFASPSYFSRLFAREVGLAPGAFRRRR